MSICITNWSELVKGAPAVFFVASIGLLKPTGSELDVDFDFFVFKKQLRPIYALYMHSVNF